MIADLDVVLVFTLTPWNFIPTQVTENVTVIELLSTVVLESHNMN